MTDLKMRLILSLKDNGVEQLVFSKIRAQLQLASFTYFIQQNPHMMFAIAHLKSSNTAKLMQPLPMLSQARIT